MFMKKTVDTEATTISGLAPVDIGVLKDIIFTDVIFVAVNIILMPPVLEQHIILPQDVMLLMVYQEEHFNVAFLTMSLVQINARLLQSFIIPVNTVEPLMNGIIIGKENGKEHTGAEPICREICL